MAFFEAVEPNNFIMEVLEVPDFISSSEAAKRLSVTSRTITRWIEEEEFPGAFKVNPGIKNSPFLIPLREFEEFEAKREALKQKGEGN